MFVRDISYVSQHRKGKYRFDKNSNKWALVSLDTLEKNLQLYIFNDNFLKYEQLIVEDQMCFVIGRDFNQNEGEQLSRMVVNKMYKLDNRLKYNITQFVNIKINYKMNNTHSRVISIKIFIDQHSNLFISIPRCFSKTKANDA